MESRETVEPAKKSSRTFRFRPLYVVILVPVMAVAGLWAWRYLSTVPQRVEYAAKTPTFSDSSDKLTRTVIVPTLDTPCPSGCNVIWCSSFQLAWNEIRDTVIKAPLEVPEAAELAARLNASKQSVADLDARSVYAAGGWIEKGIRERIKKDMAARFPSHALPDFSDYTSGILAYSYLSARVAFEHPFRQMDWALVFTDSQGNETQVAGFGLWEADRKPYEKVREQVEILYVRAKDRRNAWDLDGYVLDLCRHSKPYQVVVARVEPRGSLAETLEHIRHEMADFKRQPDYERDRWFDRSNELRVPEMFWRIDHRFVELIEKVITNAGMPFVEALQTVEFRLDRSGVVIESQALSMAASAPSRLFEFNRPFLVYVQKRGAEHPFFVMWVDNAELLVRE